MISEDVVEAINLMISYCTDSDERDGMEKLKNMLLDWSDVDWAFATVAENRDFVKRYL